MAIICQSSRILRTPTLLTALSLCEPPFLCYLFAEGDDTSTHQTEISNSRSAARPSTLYPLMPRVELLKTALRDHRELDCSPTGSIRSGEGEKCKLWHLCTNEATRSVIFSGIKNTPKSYAFLFTFSMVVILIKTLP